MNTPHTPGPWETALSFTADNRIIWDVCLPDGGDMIADLAECGDEQTQEANARLIAAAPELLEALIELHNYTETSCPKYRSIWTEKEDSLQIKVQTALVKATGQTP